MRGKLLMNTPLSCTPKVLEDRLLLEAHFYESVGCDARQALKCQHYSMFLFFIQREDEIDRNSQ